MVCLIKLYTTGLDDSVGFEEPMHYISFTKPVITLSMSSVYLSMRSIYTEIWCSFVS